VKRFLLLILFASMAQAEVFVRNHDANSVVLAPICIPAISGQGWATVDFDTTSLNVTIIASGDGAYQAFDYTGGNIDNGPADFTWGNPAASAIEIDAISTGAAAGCISLSILDTVMAVSGATEWSITFTDGESALMDHQAFIRQDSWDRICEDQGTYTCRQVMSVVLAEAAGVATYTSGTRTWVVSSPDGGETRLTLVYGAELDGDRSTSTPAPMTN